MLCVRLVLIHISLHFYITIHSCNLNLVVSTLSPRLHQSSFQDWQFVTCLDWNLSNKTVHNKDELQSWVVVLISTPVGCEGWVDPQSRIFRNQNNSLPCPGPLNWSPFFSFFFCWSHEFSTWAQSEIKITVIISFVFLNDQAHLEEIS